MTDKKSERKGASGPVTSVPSETASAAPRARDASAPFAALKGIFHSFMVKDPEVRSPYYLGRDEHGRTDLSNNLARQMDSKAKLKDAYEFQRCEKLKSYAIQNVGLVKYMLRAMKRQGCPVEPISFVKCVPCDDDTTFQALSYHDEDGDMSLWVCQNKMSGEMQSAMNRSLVHELIHAYDSCRAHVDFTDCRHHACTEIRAANLSKDCSYGNELMRGNISSTNQHKKCVRRRALESLRDNPHCPAHKAEEAVDDVFERCLADTEPFGSVPY